MLDLHVRLRCLNTVRQDYGLEQIIRQAKGENQGEIAEGEYGLYPFLLR
jgi:hypothetical protein